MLRPKIYTKRIISGKIQKPQKLFAHVSLERQLSLVLCGNFSNMMGYEQLPCISSYTQFLLHKKLWLLDISIFQFSTVFQFFYSSQKLAPKSEILFPMGRTRSVKLIKLLTPKNKL